MYTYKYMHIYIYKYMCIYIFAVSLVIEIVLVVHIISFDFIKEEPYFIVELIA